MTVGITLKFLGIIKATVSLISLLVYNHSCCIFPNEARYRIDIASGGLHFDTYYRQRNKYCVNTAVSVIFTGLSRGTHYLQ